MTNAQWAADIARRAVVSGDRRAWADRSMENRTKAGMDTIMEGIALAPHAGLWGSQSSVSSPATNFPATPGSQYSTGQATPLTRFSPPPEYPDNDPHGGFNPNSLFALERTPPSDEHPHTGGAPNLNIAYDGSPTVQRGPLLLGGPDAGGATASTLFDGAGQDACRLQKDRELRQMGRDSSSSLQGQGRRF
jgi:hypothetical protein